MRAILLIFLFVTQPVLALTFGSVDQNDTLAFNMRFEYQFGALGYQDLQPNQAQPLGGSDRLALSLAGSHQLNDAVALIGEMSWDVFTDSSQGDRLDADQVWLGARFYDRVELTVGRRDRPYTQVTDLTDVFNIFGVQGYRYQELTLDDQVTASYYNNNLDVRLSYAV